MRPSLNSACEAFRASSLFFLAAAFSFLFSLFFSALISAFVNVLPSLTISSGSASASFLVFCFLAFFIPSSGVSFTMSKSRSEEGASETASSSASPSSSRFRFRAFSSNTSWAVLCDAGSSFARFAAWRSSVVCFFFFCHCVCASMSAKSWWR